MSQKEHERLVTKAKALIAKGDLTTGRAVDAAEIAAAEAELGRPLPPAYLALITALGDIGEDPEREFAGWSGALHRIYAPADAVRVTKKLRAEWGADGRHAAKVNEAFFFMRWEATLEWYGAMATGEVRVLREHRPGTMMRVASPSVADMIAQKLGEAGAAESMQDAEAAPGEVTDLELFDPPDLEKLRAMRSLERLRLGGVKRAEDLEVLGSLPNLRVLDLWYGDHDLPDALFCAPRLEKIEMRNAVLTERYTSGLSGLLAWMVKTKVPPSERARWVRLLADDEAWAAKHATDAHLLEALDAPSERLAENALRMLAARLAPPGPLEGARVALLGKTLVKKDALASQLEAAGAVLEKKLGPKTTHALVGVGPKGAWREAQKRKIPLVHEQHVRARLDAKGARFLAKEGAETAERLRELLLSPDPASATLAVKMMQEGGVPDGVLEAILLVVQNPKANAKARKALEALAEEKLPSFPRIVRAVLARTNLWGSGATKLADRLAELDQKSKGAISGRRLALDFLAIEHARREDDGDDEPFGDRAMLYAFETGDEALIREAVAIARHGPLLSLAGLEARIGPALDKAPKLLASIAPPITRVSLRWVYLKKVPEAVLGLRGLERLDLGDNDLKELPAGLGALASLEHLDVANNRIGVWPDVIAKLTKLKVLRIGQDESKPRLRALPDAIGALRALETLSLAGQRVALPEALASLPALAELDLEGCKLPEVPAVLERIPKLARLNVDRADAPDRAAWKALLARLRAKGVAIT